MTKPEGAFRPWAFGFRHSFVILISAFVISAPGCFPKPNAANIALRKEVQALSAQVADLTSRHDADRAQLAAISKERSVPTLPPDRLQKLFTTSRLIFKNLVIGQDLDASRPGDEGFKIAVVPVDQFGDEFKSSGALRVELFDLAEGNARLGTWSFDTAEAQRKWMSTLVIDGYVLTMPWQTAPKNAKLLVKATFTEELTGATFEATHDLTVVTPN